MAHFDLAHSALRRQFFYTKPGEEALGRHIRETESIPLFFKKMEEEDSLQKRSVGVYDAAQLGRDSPHKYLLTSETCPQCLSTVCH